MHLETAEIDRHGPLSNCRPPCDDGLTVVAGPNESGKTLYLEGLLQLLEPGIVEYMTPGPRVDGTPAGRVVLDDGTERHVLGDGTSLGDVSRIEPRHLYELFVVRDSDLVLPEGTDYYTTLVEHLGDIHTTEIGAIREALVEDGRLTPTTLNLSNTDFDTKDARNDAAALAADVDAYLETVEAQGIAETVQERLRLRSTLSTVEAEVETQRLAGRVADLEDASEQLQTYEDATQSIRDLEGFTRGTLEELRGLEGDLEHARERRADVEAALERKRASAERCREELDAARDHLVELETRERAVEAVGETLAAYRDATADRDGEGFASRLALLRQAAVAALAGGGVAVGGGALAGSTPALAVGLVLLVVSVGAWLGHRRLADRREAAADLERELLETARDAGFEVEAPADVAPRVGEFEKDLERADERVKRLEARDDELTSGVDGLEADLESVEADAADLEAQLEAVLADRGVDSIAAFAERVETRERHERERSDAELVLERAVGEPAADDPDSRIAHWEAELDARRADLDDPGVDPAAYDEAELERLETRRSDLSSRLEALEADLEAYNDRLDEFDRRAGALSPPPFVEVDPSLAARTDEGLRELAADCREVVDRIERNAEVSRRAIRILDDIRGDEEQKVGTLFDPEGPASETFAHLTDGRYAAVDYDSEAATLAVTTADGRELAPRQLSRGTRDQLYFAARLSLARQLLGGDPGFLLLDDPFLAADPARLRNGFETLAGLCHDGWQVLYLTAKPAVHEGMAREFDCPVYELEPLAD